MATLLGFQTSADAALPPDFTDELVADGFGSPVVLKSLPGGAMLVGQRDGTIFEVDTSTVPSTVTLWHDVPLVDSTGEKGLTNFVLDPDFAENNYIYVYYHSQASDRARISRFEAGPNFAESESLIWEDLLPTSLQIISDHWGGAMGFGPDGLLYLAIGDKKDNPADSQDLTLAAGKILRLNTAGLDLVGPWIPGAHNPHMIPDDNPFIDGPGGDLDEIWALGLRNPFRGQWDLESGRFFIAEVGGNVQSGPDASHEDLHAVTTADAGVNFGWPDCEGPDCVGEPPADYSPPIMSIQHPESRALVAGPVYRDAQFPSEYYGALFFTDYVRGWLRYTFVDETGQIAPGVPGSGYDLAELGDLSFPVDLEVGADGSLYYVSIASGHLRRISYNNANLAPVITSASADVTVSSTSPLDVVFTGIANDPEGQTLDYLWDFGDGSSGAGPVASHRYSAKGPYTARLFVSDATRTTISDPIEITVGEAPVPVISAPVNGSSFRAGDTITAMATVTDGDGVTDDSDIRWSVEFIHDSHVHPVLTEVAGTACAPTGTSCLDFEVPVTGHHFSGSTGYRFVATVTDADGLRGADQAEVVPDKVDITFSTDIPGDGVILRLDQEPRTSPFTIDTLINFEHTIQAPTNQLIAGDFFFFDRWSPLPGTTSESVTITVPAADAFWSASYLNTGPPPRVVDGLLALYDFDEGFGDIVADSSGTGTALDLTIADPDAVTWQPGGLRVDSATLIASQGAATKISEAVVASGEVTLEAWIAPENLTQTGPARIVGLSNSSTQRNITLGQGDSGSVSGDRFNGRLRSSVTTANGLPSTGTDAGTVSTALTHVVFTRAADGSVVYYIDGVAVETATVNGDLDDWNNGYPVVLANEIGGGRAWLGVFELVAFYDRALTPAEVVQNFGAGSGVEPVGGPPIANDDDFATGEDTAVAGDVLVDNGAGADSDPDGDPLLVSAVNGNADAVGIATTLASGAVVTVNADGSFSYDPAGAFDQLGVGESSTDSFDYSIIDGNLNSASATATIAITGTNDAPSISAIADVEVEVGSLGQVNLAAVDADSAGLSFSLEGAAPAFVGLTDNGNGTAVLALSPTSSDLGSYLISVGVSDDAVPAETDSTSFTVTVVEEPTAPPRVVDGLLALYDFDEGFGDIVADSSGVGVPLDLTVADAGAVSWVPGGLSVDAATVIGSSGAASKVSDAIELSGAVTLEAWVTPDNVVQSGPARVVSLSSSSTQRNITLGQGNSGSVPGTVWTTRLRTSITSPNGTPSVSTPPGSASTALSHVVYTRDTFGAVRFYVDGVLVQSTTVGGSLAAWDSSYGLFLANEATGEREWLGTYHLVALYDKALAASEVARNFAAGTGGVPIGDPPTAQDDTFDVIQDTDFTANVLADNGNGPDADPNGDVVAVTAIDGEPGAVGTPIVLPSGASVTVTSIGDLVYTQNGAFASLAEGVQTIDSFAYTVTDGNLGFDTASVTVTITGTNDAPVVAEIDDLTVTESTVQDIVVAATDVDGDPLALALDPGAPDFVSLVDNNDGTATITAAPQLPDLGSWPITITVLDNGDPALSDSTSFVLTVSDQPVTPPRVQAGLIALYEFEDGSGTTVADTSGVGVALDLTIADPTAVTWTPTGLSINAATIISSGTAASKISDAVERSGAVTLEAWVTPDNITQSGPARVASVSASSRQRNITLGQGRSGGADGDVWSARLRTTDTSDNGLPSVATGAGTATTSLTHVVYTRDSSGQVAFYVDGVEVTSAVSTGNLSGWNGNYELHLANEATGGRAWLGEFELVAFYDRALAPSEVAQNFDAPR